MGPIHSFKAISTQFWAPRPRFTENDIQADAYKGKVFIVTGGNSGLGYELCKILFRSGATIYMASRSKERAEAVIQSIQSTHPGATHPNRLKFLPLDLGDPSSVRQAALLFAQQESKLDVLWNNAGIGANAVKYGDQTAQGLEILTGIHCCLSSKLPLLTAHYHVSYGWMSTILVDTSAPKDGLDISALATGLPARIDNYAASKAEVWILSREFAERYRDDGILSVTINPGSLDTGSFRGTPRVALFLMRLTILHKPVLGAYTMLYAGLSQDITAENSGIFVYPWGRLVPDRDVVRQDILQAMEPEGKGEKAIGKKLWAWCESQWNSAS
ncbi:NAD(P)-binding protein [Xylariaceae sp. FL0594]|nr:NAD(P)-binding protein [Xylariaceae sp. FL0594]